MSGHITKDIPCFYGWSPRYGGFLSHGGTPRWMVKIKENPIRMDDMGGYSYFRKPPSTNCLWSPPNFPWRAPQKTHHHGTLLFSTDPRPRRSLSEAAIKEMLMEVPWSSIEGISFGLKLQWSIRLLLLIMMTNGNYIIYIYTNIDVNHVIISISIILWITYDNILLMITKGNCIWRLVTVEAPETTKGLVCLCLIFSVSI